MKGFHPTPSDIVDRMVVRLFELSRPSEVDNVLDPGCGHGAFIDGILRWCDRHQAPVPNIYGVELDARFIPALKEKYRSNPRIHILHTDFFDITKRSFQFVIGNPPYVAITALSEAEKSTYRRRFASAHGRFDLYFLFLEQALSLLDPDGRLVFITPEKFLYVESARPLRQLLTRHDVSSIELLGEDSFVGLVTYPAVTTIEGRKRGCHTSVVLRNGTKRRFRTNPTGDSWLPLICGETEVGSTTLGDVCLRVSAGIATGADDVFVRRWSDVPENLKNLAYCTVAGRQISSRGIRLADECAMLIPYRKDGALFAEHEITELLTFLGPKDIQDRLLRRTCVTRQRSPKLWYAFHETPRLEELLRPKILFKDIVQEPVFVADLAGTFVPRHSVYFIVPKSEAMLKPLLRYLRSDRCIEWLHRNCQRAANGFLRMQSTVLKRLPVPPHLVELAADRSASSLALAAAASS